MWDVCDMPKKHRCWRLRTERGHDSWRYSRHSPISCRSHDECSPWQPFLSLVTHVLRPRRWLSHLRDSAMAFAPSIGTSGNPGDLKINVSTASMTLVLITFRFTMFQCTNRICWLHWFNKKNWTFAAASSSRCNIALVSHPFCSGPLDFRRIDEPWDSSTRCDAAIWQ